MEMFVFAAVAFVVLVLLARRNGAYGGSRHGDPRGSDVVPPVPPNTAIGGFRDPRPGRRN